MNEIRKIERGVIFALTIMMALVIVVSTIELGWIIFKDIFLPPICSSTPNFTRSSASS